MKILIIDNDEDDIFILSDALKNVWPNATLRMCNTDGGWKTLIQNDATSPDIIFIDPFPFGGKECLTQLKKLNEFLSIKIIVYTDETRQLKMDEFMEIGASQILLKTGNYDQLNISLAALNDPILI